MIWSLDKATENAALRYPLPIAASSPARQWPGHRTEASTWNDRVIQPARWPTDTLISSPNQIINFFKEGFHTQAVAMVVSWGGMGRRSKDIYGERSEKEIRRIGESIHYSAESILRSGSLADAWIVLTGNGEGQLGWSAVMASKTLYFLCRSLGFEDDPPVPIDNKVIRDIVWPKFRNAVPKEQRPANWDGADLGGYMRYMTAILTWAKQRSWTTTQTENTIFHEYLPKNS
jgi:hypothetical protein